MNILSEIRTRIFQISTGLLLAALVILGALYMSEKSRAKTLEVKVTEKNTEIVKLNLEKDALNARLADKDVAKWALADENQKAIESNSDQCNRLIKSAVTAAQIPPKIIFKETAPNEKNNDAVATCPDLFSLHDIESAFNTASGSGN